VGGSDCRPLHNAKNEQKGAPVSFEVDFGDSVFDVVIHANDDRLIVELEQRQPSSRHPIDSTSADAASVHRAGLC
jgi:light-regulated signal transduction histidine kinase (bacteriophytochrome)